MTKRLAISGVVVAFALMSGALAVFGTAYARQSEKVEDLENQNNRILADHQAIGQQVAAQSKKVGQQSKQVEGAIRSAYRNGFLAGRSAAGLPAALAPLARYAAIRMLVPHGVPSQVASRRPAIAADATGYVVRWRGLALFASTTDPLSVWTRQGLGDAGRSVTLGRHRVRRLVGPSGVIFAWRKRGATYAVLALPRLESAARPLIASMR